jgi:hypothetical protein
MSGKLANAPLTEVVFEIRWETQTATAPFVTDPGYSKVFDSFTAYARKQGFTRIVDKQPPYSGLLNSISRRFYKEKTEFPILQIGPGTFASNASAEYEWNEFKERSLKAASELIRSYPKHKEHRLRISHVELRYIDTFSEAIAPVTDVTQFMRDATRLELHLPNFWHNDNLSQEVRGRIVLDVDARKPAGARFYFDLGSANLDDTPIVRMESKIVATRDNVLPIGKDFEQALSEWLDEAHDITSPSFKALIKEDVLEKFR